MKKNDNNKSIEIGLLWGICIGVALGITLDNLLFTIPVGTGVGLVFGILVNEKKKK